MKVNLPKKFQLLIILSIFLVGINSILMENAYSENSSYYVINPDFEGKPTSAIVDEKSNKVYVTDFFGGKLVVLDSKTNEILDSIDVVKTPFGVGVNPNTNMIYVGGEHANTLSVLDATTGLVIKDITIKDPYDIAVNPNNDTVYVTSDRLSLVYVIDGMTNEIVMSFDVMVPCGIAVNSVTGMVYVTSESENLVHVWDGNINEQVTTIQVQESPRGVTVNPVTNMIYVTNQETNTVSVIDGAKNKVTNSINVGEIPRRVVSDYKSNIVYVSNQGSKEISVIDGFENKVIKTIPVKEPFELAINPDTGKLYSMYYGGELSIITKTTNQLSPLKQLTLGVDPHNVTCREGLSLVLKNFNSFSACVKPSSVQKLIERGWALGDASDLEMEIKN